MPTRIIHAVLRSAGRCRIRPIRCQQAESLRLAIVGLALVIALGAGLGADCRAAADRSSLHIATFHCEISPPLGKPIGMGFIKFAQTKEHPLLAKGVLLKDEGGVYVLCALDWMEVRNASYDFLLLPTATPVARQTAWLIRPA